MAALSAEEAGPLPAAKVPVARTASRWKGAEDQEQPASVAVDALVPPPVYKLSWDPAK